MSRIYHYYNGEFIPADPREDGAGEPMKTIAAMSMPHGLDPNQFLPMMTRACRKTDGTFAIVVFPQEYFLSGHVASLRGSKENAWITSFGVLAGATRKMPMPSYLPCPIVVVRNKVILRMLAEKSPLFRPAWTALANATTDRTWLCLSDPLPEDWVRKTEPGDERLFRECKCQDVTTAPNWTGKVPGLQIAWEQATDAFGAGRETDAIRCLESITAADPTIPQAWNALGCVYGKMQQYDSALRCFRRCAELTPRWAENTAFIGHAMGCTGRYDEAEQLFRRALEQNPFEETALHGLAHDLDKLGRTEEALPVHALLCELAPHDRAWTDYGIALYRTGRYMEAAAAGAEALKLNDSAPCWNNYGFYLAAAGQYPGAVAACRRALEVDPDFTLAWDSLGYAHLLAGNASSAVEALLRALQHDSEYPEAWRHLIHAYHRAGDTAHEKSSLGCLRGIFPQEAAKVEQELASGKVS